MAINTRLIDLISEAGSPRIVVVGDIILDSYIQGDANRISPEAPIQVLDVNEERNALGGAANVAANLKNLGARVEMGGVLGEDHNGAVLQAIFASMGIGTSSVVSDPGRPTTHKTRVLAHNQQLVRIDREVRENLSVELEERLIEALTPLLEEADAVVLSDYAKGVLSGRTIQIIVECAGEKVLVDPKGRDFNRYKGCRLITPNRREAEEATGVLLRDKDNLRRAAEILFERVGVREVVITLGGDGIFYSNGPGDHCIIPAESRSVYDVTGAGDTVISLLAFGHAAGIGLDDAVRIANAGAGIVVGKLGVAAPNRNELIDFFSSGTTRYMDKILTRSRASETAKEIRMRGDRLVFTNGCFDLVHAGHVSFFRAAKKMGDYLMVGVNSDDSVRRNKGPKRPILSLDERMEMLASLQVVDYVVAFSEDTPLELIKEVTPQVLIKGEDWKEKGVVGREWVEEQGGEVALVPLRRGYSTTSLIERILERYGKGDA